MKNNIVYDIALTAATLTASPVIACDGSSATNNMHAYNEFIMDNETVTSNTTINYRQYLNSIMIRQSFDKQLNDKRITLPKDTIHIFDKISEKCSNFDIKEVYADYSSASNAIRIDMAIDNNFLLIVRKKIEEDEDNCVAVSLSKGSEDYLVDYLDLDFFIKEVTACIKG